MVARHRHRRLLQTGSGWTTPGQFGEMQVNPVRRRLAIVDADGSAVEPIGIPLYDARSQYAIGDFVVRGATILRCTTAIPVPHAFNAAEWVEAGKSQADLKTFFDTVYSALGHNHDALYAPIVHNHDLLYAPLVHNHDALYAPLVHNHDSVYGRLAASNTWTVGQNFLDIVNLQGTYTAVYGNLSVACGAGGFVPTIQGIDLRGTGTTSLRVVANGSDQQARVELNNSLRDWLIYTQGGALNFHDLTAGAGRAKISDAGVVTIAQNIVVGSTIQAGSQIIAYNDANFGLTRDGSFSYLQFRNACHLAQSLSDGSFTFTGGSALFKILDFGQHMSTGVNIWSAAGHIGSRGYTVGTLPSAAANGGSAVFATNAGIGYTWAWSDGANWLGPSVLAVIV